MKRFLFFILCFSMLILTGCSCEHRWEDANCTTPKTCEACGESQGEALGHVWQEASCSTPESCTRCGETRGEAAGHSFDEWALDAEKMSHRCESCGERETKEIDIDAFLEQELPGYWHISMYENAAGRIYSVDSLSRHSMKFAYSCDPAYAFYEDRTGKLFGTNLKFNWYWDRWETRHDIKMHLISIHLENLETSEISALTLMVPFDSSEYYLAEATPSENIKMLLFSKRDGKTLSPLLEGKWLAYSNNQLYNICFSDDRSFSANFDGEIKGFWQPRPITEEDGIEATILLTYEKNEESKTVRAYFSAPNYEYNPLTEDWEKDGLSLELSFEDNYISFTCRNEEEVEKIVSDSLAAVCKTWTSTDVINYSGDILAAADIFNRRQSQTATTDYSITLNEDGSFIALLDTDISGTWMLADIEFGYFDSYEVYLYSEVWSSHPSQQMAVYTDGTASLYIYETNAEFNATYPVARYTFKAMSPEQLAEYRAMLEAAPKLLAGHWVGNPEHGDYQNYVRNADCYLDIYEDGTFEGVLSEAVSGTWCFTGLGEYGLELQLKFDHGVTRYGAIMKEDSLHVFYEDRSGKMWEVDLIK